MIKTTFFIFISFFMLCAGENDFIIPLNEHKQKLLNASFEHLDSLKSIPSGKKVAVKRAFSSALIPGLGQYFNKSYIRSALYAGIEIAAISTYFIYESKGDNKDKQMQKFGDNHWSEHKYWSKIYYEALEQKLQGDSDFSDLPDYDLYTDVSDQGIESQLLIDYFVNGNQRNNTLVNSLRKYQNLLNYSHTLPRTRTQQYYEMIYKYPGQFANAWDDADFYRTYSLDGSDLSSNALEFRDLRITMEDLYDVARTATWGILINHVISTMDAFITAKNQEKNYDLSFQSFDQRINYQRITFYGLQIKW